MYVIIGGGALLPFILLAVTLVVGSAYAVVDFFFKYWMYFALGSGILLLIRTIAVAVKSYEKWNAALYFVLEIIRIILTYVTLIWYTNDWMITAQDSILVFILKAGVEGIFVLGLVGLAISVPWMIFSDDADFEDLPWIMPIAGIVLILIPLVLRMIVEYVNTGAVFPVELFKQLM